jgi:ribosomal protein S18 acetylase RimI-like enzyme
MAVTFRQATADDAESVADVYLASRKTFLPYAPLAHSDEDVRGYIRDRLLVQFEVTVGVSRGEIVGMMALSRSGGCGWVEQLYLRPDAVGRGIGSALIERAKSALGAPVRLYTFQQNEGARRFYERHGFTAIEFGDGSGNEEHCPDVLYEWRG